MHFDINKLKGRLDFLEVLLNNTMISIREEKYLMILRK